MEGVYNKGTQIPTTTFTPAGPSLTPKEIAQEKRYLDIDAIFADAIAICRKSTQESKKTARIFNQITGDQVEKANEDKLETYATKHIAVSNTAQAVGEIVGAYAGAGNLISAGAGAVIKGTLHAGGQYYGSYNDKGYDQARQASDYLYSHQNDASRSFKESMQQSDQALKELINHEDKDAQSRETIVNKLHS